MHVPDCKALLLAAIVPFLSAVAARGQEPAGAHLACGLEPGPARAASAVIDGDTVRLDDGKIVKLAGILAPRAFDVGAERGTWPPEDGARAALETLVRGQSVALAFSGPRTDRHERVIAHLFVARDDQRMWVQQALVARGHARVHAAPGASACLAHLLEAEGRARSSNLGLWAHAAYQMRPADRPTELLRYASTYQLVSGTVAKVTGSRTLAILELASSEPASIEGSGRRTQRTRIVWKRGVAALDGDVRSLEGAQILVRGWIDNRGNPEMELLVPGQLEVTASAAPNGSAQRQRSRRSSSRGAQGSDQQGSAERGKNESPSESLPGGKQ